MGKKKTRRTWTKTNDSLSPTASRRRACFKAIAVLLSVLILEAISRAFWYGFCHQEVTDRQMQHLVFWEEAWHKDIPYTFRPNSRGLIARTASQINNIGLRGEDVDLAVPGKRILCVGDSVTFGYTVSGDDKTYPHLLQQRLRQAGHPWTVLNGGMPRYRVEHMVNLFTERMGSLKPDIVILLGGWNDANDLVLKPAPTALQVIAQWVEKNIFTYRLVHRTLQSTDLFGDTPTARIGATIDQDGCAQFAGAVHRLTTLSQKHSATPVLCTLPHFYANRSTEEARQKLALFSPFGSEEQIESVAEEMNARIRTIAAKESVLLVEFSRIDQASLFYDAVHPNDQGTAMIAEQVFQALQDSGVLVAK